MPLKQFVSSPTAIRWVVVKAGDSNAYVDSLTIF